MTAVAHHMSHGLQDGHRVTLSPISSSPLLVEMKLPAGSRTQLESASLVK